MFNKMSLQLRFALMLTAIFFVSLPLVGASAYYVLQKNINEDVFAQAEFFLNTMESVRQQVGKVMRPALQNYMGTRFDTRFMSTSFAARGVAERLKKISTIHSGIFLSIRAIPKSGGSSSRHHSILFEKQGRQGNQGLHHERQAEFLCCQAGRNGKFLHAMQHSQQRSRNLGIWPKAAFGWQPDQVIASLIVYVPRSSPRTPRIQGPFDLYALVLSGFPGDLIHH
jgi:hypothetical protein